MTDIQMPNDDEMIAFIASVGVPIPRREIAKSFAIKGSGARTILKEQLTKLADAGRLTRHAGKAYALPSGLPEVLVLRITHRNAEGEWMATPLEEGEIHNAQIFIEETKRTEPVVIGDHVLAKLRRVDAQHYQARIIRKIEASRHDVVGRAVREGTQWVLYPIHRKQKTHYPVIFDGSHPVKDGEILRASLIRAQGTHQFKAKVTHIYGNENDPKIISLLSAHEADLPLEFPDEVIAQTVGMTVPPLDKREDLRLYPLVTIDGADARDFDDAVFAEPVSADQAKRKNGKIATWHLIVAIADVAHYVRPNSPLDKEAYSRGNSTYFPDRVIPMLPEALSNDLCSLRPHEDRACMAFHLWIDDMGAMVDYQITRALMRSVARLTYEQVQAAKDGMMDALIAPIMDHVIQPLYHAFEILDKARQKRGALDLDLPERKIIINEDGEMTGVQNRERLDSHKLIEEFMVLANVAAAQSLEDKNAPCIYRVHDVPSNDKIDVLHDFVQGFQLSFSKGNKIEPRRFNQLLSQARGQVFGHLINQMVLRSQSQAIYHSDNIGHFGLALDRYAHFTSPIRRYADLIVHRSLIKAYNLGEGALSDYETSTLHQIAEHISTTERRSVDAERSAVDRFSSAYLSTQIGATFAGRIAGLSRHGLFVALIDNGAEGFIPIRSLDNDYYQHDEKAFALIGERTGTIFQMGAGVTVKLKEADGISGSTIFEIVNVHKGAVIAGFSPIIAPRQKPDKRKSSFKKGQDRKADHKSKPAIGKKQKNFKGNKKLS